MRFNSITGASLVEYCIALAILVVVFIAGAKLLQDSASERAQQSQESVSHMVPCTTNGPLAGEQCY